MSQPSQKSPKGGGALCGCKEYKFKSSPQNAKQQAPLLPGQDHSIASISKNVSIKTKENTDITKGQLSQQSHLEELSDEYSD